MKLYITIMAFDVNDIITVKQLLNNSIKNNNFEYIKSIINKTVEDCNLLYTQVCYLIKLFLLNDFETNINKPFNDYNFNEIFIRKCFTLIKTGKLTNRSKKNKDDNEEDNDNEEQENEIEEDNSLLNRIKKFYDDYNKNINNKFKFVKPDNVSSISHITDALSRDIQTNIINNIELNYFKYIKEYININIKLKHKNIDDNQIIKIYNDVVDGTLYSNIEYHSWIKEHIKKIIPVFNDKIKIISFKDGIINHYKIFIKFIKKYVSENQKLLNLIHINGDNDKKTIKNIIELLTNDLTETETETETDKYKYNDWINENKNIIVNEFNLSNKIDLNKEIKNNPYMFIPFMLFMNTNLELNKSEKKYQIIPLRTNLTPKFIQINVDALVDILDSKYLLGEIKNNYHNDSRKGLILFDTYFRFDSKYIKNVIKKGYIFSGSIYTNGFEINYIFNSKSYKENKHNYHTKSKEQIKFNKENTKDLNEKEIEEFYKKQKEDKENKKKEQKNLNNEKNKKVKQDNKDKLNKIKDKLKNEIIILDNKYNEEINKIKEEHYTNLKKEFDKIDKTKKENKKLLNEIEDKLNNIFISKNVYLKYERDRNYNSLIIEYENMIEENYVKIKNKKDILDKLIKDIKNSQSLLKKELKEHNKNKFNKINKDYKKEIKEINKNINKKILKRLSKKLIEKMNLLNYETSDNKILIKEHIINVKNNISKVLIKIKEMNISNMLNEYLTDLGEINVYILTKSNNEIINTIKQCFNYISIDKIKNEKYEDLVKLVNLRLKKMKDKENLKTEEWKKKYNEIIDKLNENTKKLNKLEDDKRKIEKEFYELFKEKNILELFKDNNELKVDNLSKKALKILDKLNWVVIDPGINSLLTMMSKDCKTTMSYSKSEYLNKTQRKKIQKKIERIKKDEITKLENKLTNENIRLKTSNIYENFNEYFRLKMEIHNELVKLYQNLPRKFLLKFSGAPENKHMFIFLGVQN